MVPKVSIIIPVKKIEGILIKETIPAILSQSYQNFEIIVLPDHKPKKKSAPWPANWQNKTKIIATAPKTGPADKRDWGAKIAGGKILAFLDDDSYPDKNWLKNALKIFFLQQKSLAAVCGPILTPATDNIFQKASGYVWSTWIGSWGAGTYRSVISSRREVDDYPTVNLLVKKDDFWSVGGFDSRFWPGEDTKLCHDLVYKMGRKIVYEPKVIVYHHRRGVFLPHLRQISRYALHRGYFARILPQTSLRWGYFIPSLFFLGLIVGLILIFVLEIFNLCFISIPLAIFYLVCIFLYFLFLLLTSFQVWQKEKNIFLSLLVFPSILLTHLVYGVLFIKGYLAPKLKSRYKR